MGDLGEIGKNGGATLTVEEPEPPKPGSITTAIKEERAPDPKVVPMHAERAKKKA